MGNTHNTALETKVVHGGSYSCPHLAVTPPIHQTSTFAFRDVEHGASLFAGQEDGSKAAPA